jgi:uncharacterized protein YidB (DUF937 family)
VGLLDSVLGQVGQALASGQPQAGGIGGLGNLGGMAGALGGLLADNGSHGGLGGLVSKFEQAGMADVISSWIGTGKNAPISGDQLQQVLGREAVAGIAQKLGLNVTALLPLLVTALPALIDHLTPKGQLPAQGLGSHGDLLASISGLLQKGPSTPS